MSDSREPGELCRGLQEGGRSKLPAFPPVAPRQPPGAQRKALRHRPARGRRAGL